MKKVLLVGLAVIVASVFLIGCKETNAEAKKPNYTYRTISVPYDIYVDPETRVQYIVFKMCIGSAGGVGITPRLDANGKPMVDRKVK